MAYFVPLRNYSLTHALTITYCDSWFNTTTLQLATWYDVKNSMCKMQL